MAQFCTQCAAHCDVEARFCESCGAPLKAAAAQPDAIAKAAAPVRTRRTIGIIGAVAVVIIAGAAGLAWTLAPERASAASFGRALDQYFAANDAARDRLVCFANLPYQTTPLRIAEFDQGNRNWLDLLSRAGIYAAPRSETSGGFFKSTWMVYDITDVGRASLRNKLLCVAGGLRAVDVGGFEQVVRVGEQSMARATATMVLAQEAPWFAKAKERNAMLEQLNSGSLKVQLPVGLVDKKWQVQVDAPLAREAGSRLLRSGRVDIPSVASTSSAQAGLFDKLKSMLGIRTHPLEGKWTDETGRAAFEFTGDSVVENGHATSASFRVDGDNVYVTSVKGGGPGLMFRMRDADHAEMNFGFGGVMLTRAK
jgi:hypothetical protein